MKPIIKRELILFFLFLLIAFPAIAGVSTSLWETTKSQHFIVSYQDSSHKAYVDKLILKAEEYYQSIVEELGYRRFDFWTWDNRAKIYLFNSSEDYQKDTGRLAWSGATVHVKKRSIHTFVNQEGFFESMLPHELTHIIFREFIGMKVNLPLWIDEGVACSQEKSTLNERLQFAKNLVKSDIYLSLDNLIRISDYNLVVPRVFYSESASLVVFLLKQGYGGNSFLEFSRKLRDGSTWQDALKDVYGYKNLSDLEGQWKAFVQRE
jgi:hypothetical protein